jgi:hypothetical protein
VGADARIEAPDEASEEMKMRWIAWVAIVAAGCASPPAYTTREVAPAASAARVEVRELLPVVTVKVQDEQVELVWDLGSTHALSLPAYVLERVGARATGEVVRYTDAGGHALEARVFAVDRLEWGGVTWRGVRAVEAIWSEAYAPPLRLGVLGRPLFAGMRLVLRLGAGEVLLEPSAGCGASAAQLTNDHGLIVEARIGGEEVTALLDTAATANITTTKHLRGPQRLAIDGVALGEVELSYAPLHGLPTQILLGMPFWLTHEVMLDLGAGCAWFAPALPR